MVVARRIVLLTVAGLALTLAGCGDDEPGRAEIVAKLTSDPRMADAPSDVVDCVADWYLTQATAEQRAAFVDGAEPPAIDDPEREAAILECLKGATELPE
jgi:hypothetical protein